MAVGSILGCTFRNCNICRGPIRKCAPDNKKFPEKSCTWALRHEIGLRMGEHAASSLARRDVAIANVRPPTERAMPPRHPEHSPCQHVRHAADAHRASVARFGVMIGGLILALGSASVRAQSVPAGPTPADAFHQPCVAVHMPSGVAAGALVLPRLLNATDLRDARDPRDLRHYVDLDNRCATPPAFAPTRISDPTSVWHVHAPARETRSAAVASAALRPPSPPDFPGPAS
ncbi:hypothetical protein PMO31116_00656 [Pandoraea morbifera]|uniref:Uncharacterized protein n=1 Tax=Pandoraea morbifera TaxID=2508300 RepID=A0A5E4S8I5_9BURK|nr:hypothetical protein PMO31116_00656 [Pandoraea morbifera]